MQVEPGSYKLLWGYVNLRSELKKKKKNELESVELFRLCGDSIFYNTGQNSYKGKGPDRAGATKLSSSFTRKRKQGILCFRKSEAAASNLGTSCETPLCSQTCLTTMNFELPQDGEGTQCG